MESSVFSDRSNNGQNSKSCEPEETQGFEGNFSPNLSLIKNTICEPQNILKKQEVRPQNLTSVQSGWTCRVIHGLIINLFFMYMCGRGKVILWLLRYSQLI